MRLRTFLVGPLLLTGCGPVPFGVEEGASDFEPPCTGIVMKRLDEAVAPPAHVAAWIRIHDCKGRAFGQAFSSSDFDIYEDGEVLGPQEAQRSVEPILRKTTELTLIALDLSGSISRSGLKAEMLESVRTLIDELPDDHRIGLFGFDGRPDLVPYAYFTHDRAILMAAIEELAESPVIDDSTNLNGAVLNALSLLDEAVDTDNRSFTDLAHGTVVVFTDGRDLAARVSNGELDVQLDRTPHSTIAIGVGDEMDKDVLASIGRTAHFSLDDHPGIMGAFDKVKEDVRAEARSDYLVSYCSPSRAGVHKLRIQLNREGRVGFEVMKFNADGFGAGCDPKNAPLH